MKTLKRYAGMYWLFFKQNIKVMMEYRLDFIIGALSTFLVQGTGIATMWIIFNNIKALNGWNFYQVALVYGFLTLAKSINHIFFDNLWILGNVYIRSGKFDMLLLRPVHPLFHLIADKVQQDGFGNLIIGLLIVIESWTKAGIAATPLNILFGIIFVIFGGLIFVSINIALSATSFWFVNQMSIMWSVFQVNEFALYPISIFNRFIRIIITWFIPYAFASYYPVSYLLNKNNSSIAYISPVIACVLFVISYNIWKFGLKHYGSAGG